MELAAEWGYDPEGRLSLEAFLDGEARLRLVFQADQTAHKNAKETSDHFAHGFSNAGDLWAPARRSQELAAKYLREAIISLLDIGDDHRALLLGPIFKTPRGPSGLEHYLWASLVGEGQEFAAPDQEYPICEWKSTVKEVTFDSDSQKFSIKPEYDFEARLADGIGLTDIRVEVWDGSFHSHDDNRGTQ